MLRRNHLTIIGVHNYKDNIFSVCLRDSIITHVVLLDYFRMASFTSNFIIAVLICHISAQRYCDGDPSVRPGRPTFKPFSFSFMVTCKILCAVMRC